jgi:hypothetical protein
VYPERSAKSTVAWRRSSGGASGGAAAGLGGAGAPVPADESEAPHSMQNLAPAGFSVPQFAHTTASSQPHDMQKRAFAGLTAAQLGQVLPSIGFRIGPATLDCR